MQFDLNCDLGEDEPYPHTRALMQWVTSVNVACGGHAGSVRTIHACARLAKKFGVNFGAHPGLWSRSDMGRGAAQITPDELTLLLHHQVSAVEVIGAYEGIPLHHVKLHGALYHAVEADLHLAREYVRYVGVYWRSLKIYARSGGQVAYFARRLGVPCLAEGFADRAYQPDGRLVPRDQPGAMVNDVEEVAARVYDLMGGRGLTAVDGQRLPLQIDTLCVHADTPDAVRIARTIWRQLQGKPLYDRYLPLYLRTKSDFERKYAHDE